MVETYDYIICGAGASGLLLAYRMANDPFFDNKHILLLDKDPKNTNDRTWCYWEEGKGEWDALLYNQWDLAFFGSASFKKTFDLDPYRYKMLRGIDFYTFILKSIEGHRNITFKIEEVKEFVDNNDGVTVETTHATYTARHVFNSLFRPHKLQQQEKYPLLQQHFIGWFIKTPKPVFDAETVTFMDFSIPQKGNTRFMYVLPISENEALLEYTLFSADLLPKNEYEAGILAYIQELGIKEYEITAKEDGNIPMSCFPFEEGNTKNLLHIGTAGGWTKASTGFTFLKTSRKTKEVIEFLKKGKPLDQFHKRNKFWYYDLLFIDVLYRDNARGASLFSEMFKKRSPKKIFRFLDEQSNFIEDLSVMFSLVGKGFERALFKRLFK
ncbi:lycopene cyclase family protein [Sungkyunkwania multivorans]|uniref:Lycopene cyclase family protein n=1 Tax=Sungkyunkwania multivorans TaxID=1173618 RepID=A0ABW3D2C8_9FLAO